MIFRDSRDKNGKMLLHLPTSSWKKRQLDETSYDLMKMPYRYRPAKWSDFEKSEGKNRIEAYLKEVKKQIALGKGCLIAGPKHSGKSYTAAFLAKTFATYHKTVTWGVASEMLDNIARFKQYNDRITCLERYYSCDVLVIDDFGLEKESNCKVEIKDIIKHRFDWQKITIITSSLADFDKRYGHGYSNWLMQNFFSIILTEMITGI